MAKCEATQYDDPPKEHKFEEGICWYCGLTYAEALGGFGGNTSPRRKRPRPLKGL